MTTARETLGLIGIGLLGTALAERLLAAGFPVIGWDVNSDRRDALRELGGVVAHGADDVFETCSRVLLSLPTSEIVHDLLHDSLPLVNRTIIDTTTGDPCAVEAIAQHVAQEGGAYIDATIAGSSEQVRRGAAIGLVGGQQAVVAASDDVLRAMVHEWFHLGPVGSGSRMKLVVNLVLGLNRAVLAEGLAFARAYGMDLSQVLDVLRAGPTYSRVMETKGPKMISWDFQLEARLSQHLKDVRLILHEATRLGAKTPLSSVHEELLAALEQRGLGGEDNSVIIRAFEDS